MASQAMPAAHRDSDTVTDSAKNKFRSKCNWLIIVGGKKTVSMKKHQQMQKEYNIQADTPKARQANALREYCEGIRSLHDSDKGGLVTT